MKFSDESRGTFSQRMTRGRFAGGLAPPLHETRPGSDDLFGLEMLVFGVVDAEFALQDLAIVLPECRRRKAMEVALEG